MATTRSNRGPYLHLHGAKVLQQAQPMGTIHVGYSDRYQKLKRTLNGAVEVLDDLSSPWMPLFFLHVLPHEVQNPTTLFQHVQHRLSAELSRIKYLQRVHLRYLNYVAESITSGALHLAADPPSSSGYAIVADLQFLQVEEDEEIFDAYTLWLADQIQEGREWAPTRAAGASTSAIEKLINKGGFVAEKSDQELLGTCSICLEELSPSDGAALLRMDCSHLYHQSCILPWLEKQSSCPYCRREVDQE